VDVRVVAATNRDPSEAIREGKLREDLYYRLNVVTIALAPLRARRDDIPLLVEAFIQEFDAKYGKCIRSVDEGTLHHLREHPWPGNVRELRNAIERAIIVCDGDLIGAQHLPLAVPAPLLARETGGDTLVLPVGTTVDEAERQLIVRTLATTSNNKARAAEILGISLKTLHNKLHRYAEAE
jgi:transcriptional regulator with PAS, ATPase and Fis domain